MNFGSVRVCERWNTLPDLVKEQPNTNSFKNALDNFLTGTGKGNHPKKSSASINYRG